MDDHPVGRIPFGPPPMLEMLPPDCSAVACQVWDVISHSAAYGCEGGRPAWSVAHESERGVMDLRVEGEPPGPFDKA